MAGADQYGVWDTNSSGNYVSAPISDASGTSAALESFETSFNHDLNGDGTIGVPLPSDATVIESSGSTSLLTDGTNYFLQPAGGAAVVLSLRRGACHGRSIWRAGPRSRRSRQRPATRSP